MRVLVLLALLSHVAVADDDLDVPGRDSNELAGDAMIWEDAAIHLEPWEGGVMARFSSLGPRRENVGRAIPIKIVSAVMRDFVEIDFVDADTCAFRRATVDGRVAGLRMFVRRTDLAPVLVKPFAVTYPNGTSARLQPGVPVIPTPGGSYVFSARGDLVRLPIPHTSVGFTYTRTRVDDPKPLGGVTWKVENTNTVKLGDDDITVRHTWRAPKPTKRGDMLNLKWSTRCIELVVTAPAKNVAGFQELGWGGGSGVGYGTGEKQHTIPRGTVLKTVNGREAAIAAEEIRVYPPANGMACFDAHVTMFRLDEVTKPRTERTYRLCADEKLVDVKP
jgi:hypothetical protein